jgi:hypothetical protein
MEASALELPTATVFATASVERLNVNPSGCSANEAEACAEAPFDPLNELQLESPGVLDWGEAPVWSGLQRVLTVIEAPQTGNKNGVKNSKTKRRDPMGLVMYFP